MGSALRYGNCFNDLNRSILSLVEMNSFSAQKGLFVPILDTGFYYFADIFFSCLHHYKDSNHFRVKFDGFLLLQP